MSEYTADEHLIDPKAKLLPVTPLVDKDVVVPTTSSRGSSTARDNENSASTKSQAMTRSYCHVLSVTEIIELTKRLDIHCYIGQDRVNTVKNFKGSQQDDKYTTTPADIDMLACAQTGNSFPLDSKPLVQQQSDAGGAFESTSTEKIPIQLNLSNQPPKPFITNASESDNEAPTSSEPVPVIYPPRRPNIFNKRAPQRNVRWRPELASLETTHATEDDEKDGDGLTTEELRDFQSERETQMRQKTDKFCRMVSQYSWRPRVVEDLGEIFEIED